MLQKSQQKQYKLRHKLQFLIVLISLTILVSSIDFPGKTYAQEDKEKNKEIVESFLAKAYDQKDPKNAVKEFISKDFISSFTIDEVELEEMLTEIQQGIPDLQRTSEPAIANEDGNFVVVFSQWNSSSGDGETAELFEVQNGKIVEHSMVGKYSEELKMKFKEFQSKNNDTSTDHS